jgi:hypothetical protein
MRRRNVRVSPPRFSFAVFRFPPEVIIVNSRPDWSDARSMEPGHVRIWTPIRTHLARRLLRRTIGSEESVVG